MVGKTVSSTFRTIEFLFKAASSKRYSVLQKLYQFLQIMNAPSIEIALINWRHLSILFTKWILIVMCSQWFQSVLTSYNNLNRKLFSFYCTTLIQYVQELVKFLCTCSSRSKWNWIDYANELIQMHCDIILISKKGKKL